MPTKTMAAIKTSSSMPKSTKNGRLAWLSYIGVCGRSPARTKSSARPASTTMPLTTASVRPMLVPANEWTEKSPKMPLRVRNVP